LNGSKYDEERSEWRGIPIKKKKRGRAVRPYQKNSFNTGFGGAINYEKGGIYRRE